MVSLIPRGSTVLVATAAFAVAAVGATWHDSAAHQLPRTPTALVTVLAQASASQVSAPSSSAHMLSAEDARLARSAVGIAAHGDGHVAEFVGAACMPWSMWVEYGSADAPYNGRVRVLLRSV